MRVRVQRLACMAVLAAGAWLGSLQAAEQGADRSPRGQLLLGDGGSSSREARREAIAGLQLANMNEADRRAAEKVLRSTTLYRRLPVATFDCDPALLRFALEKPEAIVDIWRVLGISLLTLDPVGPQQWRMCDGYGTVGVLRLMHKQHAENGSATLVFHGHGAYSGQFAPQALTGTCLLLVRHRPTVSVGPGGPRHAMQIDAFLDADGVGLELVTRTLQPLIVRSGAANLHEISLFMESLSEAAEENPRGFDRLTGRLSRISDEDRRALAAIGQNAAGGQPRSSMADPFAPDRLPADLAARWMPADELEEQASGHRR